MKTLLSSMALFLAGYGAATLGREFAERQEAARLRRTWDDLDADTVERRTRPLIVPDGTYTSTGVSNWRVLYADDLLAENAGA
jgi:hypothetical protein